MLLTIDYLIINLKGDLTQQKNGLKIYSEDELNPFKLELHEYGNKTFKNVYDLYFENEKIGVLNSVPRSNIIASDLVQLQFENHLFYTKKLNDLGQLVFALVDYFALSFEGVNRLDIAIDKKENSIKYRDLYTDLITGKKLIKGREKNVSAYSVTKKGSAMFQGFTVGKRSSSRFLRIYNKTKALEQPTQPKPYILEYFKLNNLQASPGLDVWRYEYQLNASFFTYLRKLGNNITYDLFDNDTLFQLIKLAEKNHFEIVYNTGKTETNKERSFPLIDWDNFKKILSLKVEFLVSRIKRVFEPSINVQKRLIKGLLRQYYITQATNYLKVMCKVLNDYDLTEWFVKKLDFYFFEFQNKEKVKNHFDVDAFINNVNYYTRIPKPKDNFNEFELPTITNLKTIF